jgi:hypothetical protein
MQRSLEERLSQRCNRDMRPSHILCLGKRCQSLKVQDDHLCVLELPEARSRRVRDFFNPEGCVDQRGDRVEALWSDGLATLEKENVFDAASAVRRVHHHSRIAGAAIGIREKRDAPLGCDVEHRALKMVSVGHLLCDDGLEKSNGIVDNILHGHAVDVRGQRRQGWVCSKRRSGIGCGVRDGEIVLREPWRSGQDSAFRMIPRH